jgi:NAD-dependent deacetylase
MTTDLLTEKIVMSAELIARSTHVVAFSGAGISTDSGIPDFRSPDCGLWQGIDPLEVASIYGFKRNPQKFYDWVRPLTVATHNALPNRAHTALVRLEQMGYLRSIITQNIDMLHTKAGSSQVHELHGHMRQGTCINCYKKHDGELILQQILSNGEYPRCTKCNHAIKPDVILFGEQLPYQEFSAAQSEARNSDLMIVIGSSLEVAPAGDIPLLATRTGSRLIIINLEPTPADHFADVVIHDRAAIALPEIVRQMEKSL